ncbi:IS110 family transposase, partial [Jiangella muralis]|uniref:IS110 family transposase n=1 Tax=Jiangella muralis TaxID=702383 RepID=UPI0012FA4C77
MVTVGIDPHKQTHTAVIIDDTGRRLGKALTVPDDPASVAKLLSWAGRHAAGASVTWAIEDGRGLARRLATALVAAGASVVWVPVRLMVAERRHTGPR